MRYTRAPLPLALAAAAALIGVAGCRGAGSASARTSLRDSTLVIATPSDIDNLVPPLVSTTEGKQVMDLVFDYLARPVAPVQTIGDAGFRPELARSWDWAPDSLSIAFHVDPRARWHDGAPVTARDVAFSFALYTDSVVASPHASDFAGIDSVTVRDSLTAVVWWTHRNPEQFFQIAYNLVVMPQHLLGAVPRAALAASAFAQHPIGSGRYRFVDWTHGAVLHIAADSANYRGRPQFARVTWVIRPDPKAALLSVLSGEADFTETVQGTSMREVARTPGVRAVEYGSLDYGYMVFNLRPHGSPRHASPFADRALRVALTEAIDRPAVVRSALDSLGRVALGPFTRAQAPADSTLREIGFDSARAARALDSLGWRMDPARGIRVRNGQPLAFSLLLPSSSPARMRLGVLLQAQLARVGARVAVDPEEAVVFVRRLGTGDFDAALGAWHTDPSPVTLRQSWGTPHGDDLGANYGGYSNPALDATMDSAAAAFDPARRAALFRRAYQTLVDDAPAVWLYEPRNVAVIRKGIDPVGMRADGWWANLPDWHPAGVAVASR